MTLGLALRVPAGLALALAVLAAPGARAQSAPPPGVDTLTLEELLERIEARNPGLAAMRAGAEAAALRRPAASTFPDPMLQVGVMNLGLPALRADMASSMAPSVQLMQMIPFPGKRALQGEIAALDQTMARESAAEMRWEVRAMAAAMFYDAWALERRVEVMEETLSLLGEFRQAARAMYAAGMGSQTDVLRAEVEAARMEAEIGTMRAMRAGMAARLNGLLALPPGLPLGPLALGRLPVEVPPRDSLLAWALSSRPSLARGRQAVEQARARRELAQKEFWPDLTVGVGYGQRPSDMGTERMGSAMIGVSLPVFASRRQGAMRDEAAAMERMALAELAALEAEVSARVTELVAETERARALLRLYRNEIVPQARATVQSALASYRVGGVDFMTLLEAQMAVNRFEGEFLDLLAGYGKALAALEAALGRTLPPSQETLLVEVP